MATQTSQQSWTISATFSLQLCMSKSSEKANVSTMTQQFNNEFTNNWSLLNAILGEGDLTQWLEHWNSNLKTLGSIPWRFRVNKSCAACTQICTHVEDPIAISRKRVRLTANTTHGGKTVVPYYGCSLSPGKAVWISCALHIIWEKKVV